MQIPDDEKPSPKRAYWIDDLPADLRKQLIEALERDLENGPEVDAGSADELEPNRHSHRRAFNLADLSDAEASELIDALEKSIAED